MAESKDRTVAVRIDRMLAAQIGDRAARGAGTAGKQVRSDLGLFYLLLAAELERIDLTLGEASVVADVLNSPLIDPDGVRAGRIVWAEFVQAFTDARDRGGDTSSYGAKHGIEEDALLEKVRRLGPAADYALRDAISRWWQADAEPTVEGFAAVGLRIKP